MHAFFHLKGLYIFFLLNYILSSLVYTSFVRSFSSVLGILSFPPAPPRYTFSKYAFSSHWRLWFFKVFYAVPFDSWNVSFEISWSISWWLWHFTILWFMSYFFFLECSTIFELYFFLKPLSVRFLKFVTYLFLCRFLIFHAYCPNLLDLKWNCSWFSIPLLVITANFVI